MRRRLIGAAVAGIAVSGSAAAQAATLTPAAVGEDPNGPAVFRFPQAVAFSPGGSTVFVADEFGGHVQAFARDGNYRFAIGYRATRREDGRLGVVGGVATDKSGHLFVLDSEDDSVQVFDASDGRYLTRFGSSADFKLLSGDPDTGAGIASGGISVFQATPGGPLVVYVADQGNDRVARFVLDPGTLAASAPSYSPDSLGLSAPQGLTLNGDGSRLYVADDDNDRVVVLDPTTLAFVAQVGSTGRGQGQFMNPYDVAVDAKNQLYVADNLNSRVDVFDASSLASLGTFGRPAYGPGLTNFEILRGVGAVGDDPAGGVIVADTANNRVQLLDPSGAPTGAWGIAGRGPGYEVRPGGADFLPDGSIGVADSFDERVERFDPDGTYQGQSGQVSTSTGYTTEGDDPGQFSRPFDVAYDALGDAFVADTGNDRVQEIAPHGSVPYTSPVGELRAPQSIAAGPAGSFYVADTGHGTVRQIMPGGADTVAFSGLESPSAVAVQGASVYVADATHVEDATTGTQIDPPPGESAWDHPQGLAVAADGTLYVSERRPGTADGARVVRGAPNVGGYTWDTLATEGTALDQVVEPANLSLDAAGTTLLVADTGNDRLLRFDAPGAAPAVTAPITVSIDQPTRGTVSSDVPGIACVTDCEQRFGPGRTVTLTASRSPATRSSAGAARARRPGPSRPASSGRAPPRPSAPRSARPSRPRPRPPRRRPRHPRPS